MLRARLVLLVVLALLLPPFARAEEPTDGRCDATGRLACAAADAGGNVACAVSLDGSVATCSWSGGFLWRAFSPSNLPGDADLAWSRVVTACLDAACSVVASQQGGGPCSWNVLVDCEGSDTDAGTLPPVTLALGQCYRVTVVVSATVDATAALAGHALGSATWTETREAAGAACFVDNGR